MKAEQLNDSIVLYEGPCEEVLPTLTGIDAVVTDPPYGIGYSTGQMTTSKRPIRHHGVKIHGDDFTFDPAPLLAFKVPTILWGANFYSDKLPGAGWLVWDKERPDELDQATCELAWTNCVKGVRRFRHLWHGLCRATEIGEHLHPTQKPVELMRWCINQLPNSCGTILDAYAGSGSLGIAAMLEHRKAILIEKDPKYCDVIRRRVERFDCQQPGSLFRTQQPALC
jgi:site-specific DNA-methyltransferase (adenine-specific)/modification methylase